MAKSSVRFFFSILALCVLVHGNKSKHEIGIFELKKGNISLKLTNYGATIISLVLPDRNGKLADVVLGYDSIKDYMNGTAYFGATVGRVANRIGGAQFTLNGTHYKLDANEGSNTLHGGSKGFSRRVWEVKKYHNEGHAPYITFGYHSRDGEEGFPGDLYVTATFVLVDHGLDVTMRAKALNKATPVNLAQHTYWNIGGHTSSNILSNKIQIFASHITPVNSALIPTGKISPVKGTPYDLLKPTTIADKIKGLPYGYDINYCLDGHAHRLKKAAVVYDKKSGRVLELYTNQPGLQFYTANYLKDIKGKGGFIYEAHDALCLETQGFPDSVNHPNFPSQIIFPGKVYLHRMVFKFCTKSMKS